MSSKKIFLNTSETLERVRKALPSGHPLLAEAKGAASSTRRESGKPTVDLASRFRAPQGWSGELGMAFPVEGGEKLSSPFAFLWISRSPEEPDQRGGASAIQFTLDLTPARYKIEYWKAAEGKLIGVELGTGPCLVLSPPEDVPLVVRVQVLAKIDKKDGSV